MTDGGTLRLEDFIQAVQSQLDNAQAAMAIKARNLNLPLTFAIKDINLDLRAHIEFVASEIRIRPAAAGETDASVFHLVFTAITRPAIEENAISFAEDEEDEPLDMAESGLTPDQITRLKWAGVQTIRQFQELDQKNAVHTIGRVTNLPVDRLRKALDRAARPRVDIVEPVAPDNADGGPPLLRVKGRNLVRKEGFPQVRIRNRPVSILKSSAGELLLAPSDDQWSGEITIEPAPQVATSMAFDLSECAPGPDLQLAREGGAS
ncbi:hypothetical protein ACI5KX_04960 [Erythrobacter sp. GH1-10]|uniref:hypothetical protein n=1 Tax=Erythrobacter sp. GH1-10 TaxID=3349334 RepID=UPI003877BA3E